MLERLSVFAGGCSLDDAEAVVGGDTVDELDVLEHLSALVRRSLVLADDHEGHTRYRLLETVRQYAHERLEQSGAADAVQRRHAVHYAAFAEEAGRGLRGADQLAWIARLAPEMDNLRAAQAWAIDHHELDLALTIVFALCVIGTTVGHAAIQWARALATDSGIDTRPLGPALLALAVFYAVVGWQTATARDRVRGAPNCSRSSTGSTAEPRQLPGTDRHRRALRNPRGRVSTAHAAGSKLARAAGDRYETVEGLTILAMTMVDTDTDATALGHGGVRRRGA